MWAGECDQKQRLTAEDGQTAQEHQSLLIKKERSKAGNPGGDREMWGSPQAAPTLAAGDADDGALVFLLFFGSRVSGLPQRKEYWKEPPQSGFPLTGLGTPWVPSLSPSWKYPRAAVLAQTLNTGRGAGSRHLRLDEVIAGTPRWRPGT